MQYIIEADKNLIGISTRSTCESPYTAKSYYYYFYLLLLFVRFLEILRTTVSKNVTILILLDFVNKRDNCFEQYPQPISAVKPVD